MVVFIDMEKSWNDPIVFYLQYTVLFACIPMFILLFYSSNGYGRLSNESNSFLMVNEKIAWSVHLLEIVFSFGHIIYYVFFYENYSMTNIVLLMLFCAHYINRGIFYPLFMPSTSKSKWPIEFLFFSFVWITSNSLIQDRNVLFNSVYEEGYLRSTWFMFGLTVFLIGMIINIHSDYYIIKLKKQNNGDYVIPYGYLYSYITCPNYFGELIEWFGFFLCTQTTGAFIFFLFSCSNLIPKAHKNYEWYKEKFPKDFPKNRKKLVPLLY